MCARTLGGAWALALGGFRRYFERFSGVPAALVMAGGGTNERISRD